MRARARPLALALVTLLALSACIEATRTTEADADLEIVPGSAELVEGETRLFAALGSTRQVTWSSDATEVISVVASTGLVTATGAGSAVLSATSDGRSGSAAITVITAPRVLLSSQTAEFTAVEEGGDPAPITIGITNGGAAPLAGLTRTVTYAAGDPQWLSSVLGGPAPPTTLQVQPNIAQLEPGTYAAIITVAGAAPAQPAELAVTLVLAPAPAIGLSEDTVRFEATADEPDPPSQDVAVTNVGGGGETALQGLSATVDAGGEEWLEASLGSQASPATLTVQPRTGTLAAGTYAADISIASSTPGADPRDVRVEFTVAPAERPVIGLSADAAAFAGEPDGDAPAPAVINVTNEGTETLSGLSAAIAYAAGEPTGWLSATLSGTTAPATLTIQASVAGITDGTYSANVTVSSSVADVPSKTVAVTLTISSQPVIALDPASADFAGIEGGPDPTPVGIDIANGGTGTLSDLSVAVAYGDGEPDGWLDAALDDDVAPTVLTLQPTGSGLDVGTYTATVTVASGLADVEPADITVTYEITTPPPVIDPDPSSVAFPLAVSPHEQQEIGIENSGEGSLTGLSTSTAYAGASGWLTASLSGTTAPAVLTLEVSEKAALTVGTHFATVTISSTDPSVESVDVDIAFTITYSFTSHIQPLFSSHSTTASRCTSCHTMTYASQFPARAVPFDTASSTLWQKIRPGGSMAQYLPSGSETTFRDRVIRWILDGAPNN